MEFGVCTQSIIPVRKEPSHKSEMTTQLLFGELYRMMEREGSWVRMQQVYDNYEGWIHLKQARLISEGEFSLLAADGPARSADLVQLILNETANLMFPILLGSSLPGYSAEHCRIGGEDYRYEGSVHEPGASAGNPVPVPVQEIRQKIVRDAKMYLNAPYLWGGRSPFGIDCSGFVQMVFKLGNMRLLRDTGQQATQGEVVSLLAEAEAGDLVFFDDDEGTINHVGLVCERNRVIHCSGKVRIDTLDHEGIYNMEAQRYTHKLRLIKRIF
jgi:hypothetical protein